MTETSAAGGGVRGKGICLGILAVLVLTFFPAEIQATIAHEFVIDSPLLQKLEEAPPDSTFVVWIHFRDRPSFDSDPDDGLPPVSPDYVRNVGSKPAVLPRFVDELRNSLSVGATPQAIFGIAELPFVSRIEEVPREVVTSTHSHGSASSRMDVAMSAMDIETLHHQGYDGTGIRIAIIDSGVRITHEALASKASGLIWKDYVTNSATPFDDNGHGTSMAGYALGNSGGSGVEPNYKGTGYDADLMAIKVIDSLGEADMDAFGEAIQFAVSNGAKVISASLGWHADPTCLTKNGRSSAAIWVGWAVSRGVPVVVAAGNEGDGNYPCAGQTTQIRTPGDNFNAITLGATSADGTTIWAESSAGPTDDGRLKPDIVAPGQSLKGADKDSDSDYRSFQAGTSISTAFTAGIVASIREKNPAWSPAQVKAALRQTAAPRGTPVPNDVHGFGLIQATAASNAAIDMQYAWDDNFDVDTPYMSFHVRDNSYLSLQTIRASGRTFLGIYDIPYVYAGGSGWISLDNSILVAGPYVSVSTSTTLTFSAVYDSGAIRFTFLAQFLKLSSTKVEFHPHLDYVVSDGFSLQVNARLYLDFDIRNAPNDYFTNIDTNCNYNKEKRVSGEDIVVRDTITPPLTSAEVYPESLDANPWEWMLLSPGSRSNPEGANNAQVIYDKNVVFEYESRRGMSTDGRIGPDVFLDTAPAAGGTCSGGGGGGGSPFVAPWDGNEYVLDNNILPESEDFTRKVQNVDDFYRLHQSLVPKDDLYSLQIVEFEDEHTRLDRVRLLAVDHENDFGIVVNHTGDIASFEYPEPPETAVDSYGRDVLGLLSVEDGAYYEAWRGDTVDLSFGSVFLPWSRLLVKVDPGHNSKLSVDAYVLVDGSWEYVSTVHSRIHFAWEYIDLSPYVPSDDLTVRLSTTKNHRIDIVGIDTSPLHFTQVQESSLVGAYHSELGDVLSLLSAEDGQYVNITPGQQVTIEFSIPDFLDEARSFVLASSGFYTHRYQPYIGEDLTISGLAIDAAAVLSGAGPFFTWEVDVERLIWDMGDGTTLEGFVVNHVYSQAGGFTMSVAVHYMDGHTSVRERSILVRP